MVNTIFTPVRISVHELPEAAPLFFMHMNSMNDE